VTERKRVEEVLRQADRRKDEFIATLSHELRNPLAPIRNAVEVMRRAGRDSAVADRALAIMERQLQQLVRLTDDLLDMSRITHDAIELQRDRIDLRFVLRSAVESIQPLSDAAAHVLEVDLPTEPLWVFGDFTRLAQAFVNLLNNAVKYTDRGGRIALTASARDGRVTVTLTDTGIGIDPPMVPRIFDMFVQLHQDVNRTGDGLGIGLALARRLVHLHDGTIEARSGGLGTGTTFIVNLPLLVAEGDAASHAQPPVDTVVACRVLVAEDIPDAAEMMRLMLETMGHAVRVAADGVQAVAMAQEFQPQVALLDIGMPRMDGYEAARRIRAMLGQRVYLVALTGWGQEEDERRALAAGFDRHVTKPAEPELLESLIASAVGSQA
jgi:CheY-like chemotaxis protein